MTESPRRIVRESDGSTRPKPAESTRWTVAQLGAREHYSVPRAFKAANELRSLYTDTWCRWGAGIIKHGPGPLRSIAGRFHQGIPSSSVTSASIQSTFWHLTRRLVRRPQSIRDVYQWDLEYGDWFDRRVAKILNETPTQRRRRLSFELRKARLENGAKSRQKVGGTKAHKIGGVSSRESRPKAR